MKLLIILLILKLTNETSYSTKWNDFKNEIKMMFTKDDDEKRYNNFKLCFKRIQAYNKQNPQHKMAVNALCAMSHLELYDYLYKRNQPDKFKTYSSVYKVKNIPIPLEVDWRKKNFVTPVKNQYICETSYVFATTAAIESHNIIKNNKTEIFSEQQVIDCSEYTNGCHGGLHEQVYRYWREYGTMFQHNYKNTYFQKKCKYQKYLAKPLVKDFVVLPKVERAIEEALADSGPVVVEITIGNIYFFSFYRSGVHYNKNCNNKNTNHVVLLVGYGVSNKGEQYYIVKNSWGSWWGQGGYFHLARNVKSNCNVPSFATYPIL